MGEISGEPAKLDTIQELATTTQATIQHLTQSVDQVRSLAQTAMEEVNKCNQVIQVLSTKTKEIDCIKERGRVL